ncbi:adenylate/guanylate cyclase domain-containing protein [uncultured Sneathiella sp.]|uniref:adenylate/guanylate cyclase domain-containing protein n=1 Tax=uncultured Sneathiella sp. TaxID=879315 RepID=UPI0030EBC170
MSVAMSIEAINEQLLRAIGVGVAVLAAEDLRFVFRNETFHEWFDEEAPQTNLGGLFPDLDIADLMTQLQESGRLTIEIKRKARRREKIYAADFTLSEENGGGMIILVCQNISRIRELESMIDSYSQMVERNTREIKREKEQVEKLLLNMMPRSVYEEFKTFGVVIPKLYDPVSVLMLDFVGFTQMAASADPAVTVSELNDIYSAFDRIGEQYGCERIKTMGDAYITVAGLPDPTPDHARAVANAAIRFIRYLERRNEGHPNQWRCRIGITSGPVVGSVVGIQKYVYDIFGPAVNLASRLQDLSEAMEITTNGPVYDVLRDSFRFEYRGKQQVRGFDEQDIFQLMDSREPIR